MTEYVGNIPKEAISEKTRNEVKVLLANEAARKAAIRSVQADLKALDIRAGDLAKMIYDLYSFAFLNDVMRSLRLRMKNYRDKNTF